MYLLKYSLCIINLLPWSSQISSVMAMLSEVLFYSSYWQVLSFFSSWWLFPEPILSLLLPPPFLRWVKTHNLLYSKQNQLRTDSLVSLFLSLPPTPHVTSQFKAFTSLTYPHSLRSPLILNTVQPLCTPLFFVVFRIGVRIGSVCLPVLVCFLS